LSLDRRHCKTHLRPQRGEDQLLALRGLDRGHDLLILPCIDERSIDNFIVGKDILNSLDNLAAPRRDDGCQDHRHAEGFRRLRQADDVVGDHRRLVTVEIRKLKRLMINQYQDALFRRQERIQSGFQ